MNMILFCHQPPVIPCTAALSLGEGGAETGANKALLHACAYKKHSDRGWHCKLS